MNNSWSLIQCTKTVRRWWWQVHVIDQVLWVIMEAPKTSSSARTILASQPERRLKVQGSIFTHELQFVCERGKMKNWNFQTNSSRLGYSFFFQMHRLNKKCFANRKHFFFSNIFYLKKIFDTFNFFCFTSYPFLQTPFTNGYCTIFDRGYIIHIISLIIFLSTFPLLCLCFFLQYRAVKFSISCLGK